LRQSPRGTAQRQPHRPRLHLPGLIEANVSIKQRDRGLADAQDIESIVLAVAGAESGVGGRA